MRNGLDCNDPATCLETGCGNLPHMVIALPNMIIKYLVYQIR
jgi:hypothetical protein